jgi:OmpA-OmpF porin, OOP family
VKRIFLTVSIISIAFSSFSQFAFDYLRAADEYFRKGDYYSAAVYYEKYLAGGKPTGGAQTWNPYNVHKSAGSSKKDIAALSSKQQAVYNVAESYRMLNYPAKAEPAYREAAQFDKAQFPLARYWHASMLRALENYAEAESQLTAFLNEYTVDDKYKAAARTEVENLKFIQAQLSKKDINLYTVNKATVDTGAFYAPVIMPDNSMYFTSTMPDATAGKNNVYNNRIYQAVFSEGMFRSISKINIPEEKDAHQGVVSVTPDNNTMFLTRWTTDKGSRTSALYVSKRTGDKWSAPVKLDGTINAQGSNAQEPFVMPDGKRMIFASNRAGGSGGFDLWISPLDDNGNPGAAVNMGPTINTEYDERAPFYHAPSQRLIFSTNGRVGMGGFDFFESRGTIDNLSAPVNLGYPVNSVKDDIYFVSTSTTRHFLQNAMISSDRAAACCLQLFTVSKQRPLKQISGVVVSCDNNTPIAGATVTVKDPSSNATLYTRTTDASGRYSFTMEDFGNLTASATFGGYYDTSVTITMPADLDAEQQSIRDLCLTAIKLPEPDVPVVLENVYYDFDRWELKPASYPQLDRLVQLLNANPTIKIEVSAHTDSKGTNEYNQRLSQRRAQSVVDYLVRKGIDKNRITAVGYGETQPVAPNTNEDGSDNPEGREKNRRTEFKVLK